MDCSEDSPWLGKYRVDLEESAQAYEATPALFRAAVKTAIALGFFHWGKQNPIEEKRTQDPCAGIKCAVLGAPRDSVNIVIPADYQASALVCATAILPLLAGVPDINCILVGQKATNNLLVTIELCGIEQIYCCPANSIMDLLFPFQQSRAFMFFLHNGTLRTVVELWAQNGQDYIDAHPEPSLWIGGNAHVDPLLLQFAYGNYRDPGNPGEKCDVVIGDPGDCPFPARIFLDEKCAGFWLFENIYPQMFRNTTIHLEQIDQ